MFLHKKYNAWIRNILNQLNQEIVRNELQICASAYYNKLNYVKQVLESIDFKIIVKDTTLINGVREQGERFLFTKMNSYLLKED